MNHADGLHDGTGIIACVFYLLMSESDAAVGSEDSIDDIVGAAFMCKGGVSPHNGIPVFRVDPVYEGRIGRFKFATLQTEYPAGFS